MTVTDPVAGTALTIDHERQTATRVRMRRWSASSRTTTAVAAAPAEAAVAFPPAEVGAIAAGSAAQWTAAFGPGVAMGMPPIAPDGERQSTALEPQMIEGVRAEGTR